MITLFTTPNELMCPGNNYPELPTDEVPITTRKLILKQKNQIYIG